MKRVKLVYQNKIRKYEVPEENCQVHVSKLIQQTCKGIKGIPVLQYCDDENDWITIGTPADLLLCLTSTETPKIYIFNATESVENRQKKKIVEDDDAVDWVQFDSERSPSVELINLAPANASPEEEPEKKMDMDQEPEPENPEEAKRDPDQEGFNLPVDWNTLVEDFLALKDPLTKLVGEIYDAVENGKDLQAAVVEGLGKAPFKNHPFVVNTMPDIQRMLSKVNHMSMFILQAGKNGLQMAVPLLLRAIAKMKQGGGSQMVDMAPIFMQLFPRWGSWLTQGLANGQEQTFDLGKVFRTMMANNLKVPQKQGEPSQQGELSDKEAQAAKDAGIVIHRGITCDVCEAKPIIGTRYKCIVCPDYDMCQSCKEKGVHQKEHPLLAMPVPAPRGGFSFGGGHNKGASELFKAPWMACKQRRAMRKAFKKCAGKMGEDAEEGPPRGHWRGFGRRGHGRRHGHGRFHGPGPAGPGPMHMTEGFESDSSDSSSSSSSSSLSNDEEWPKWHAPGPRKHYRTQRGSGRKKMSKKKMKHRLKKMQKKRKKIQNRVKRITKRQRKMARKLNHLHDVDFRLANRIGNLQHRIQSSDPPSQIQQNQPGHDPNPNERPKKHPWMHWNKPHPHYPSHFPPPRSNPPPPYISPWGDEPIAPPAPPMRMAPPMPARASIPPPMHAPPPSMYQMASPPAPPAPKAPKEFKYDKQLKLLQEMGFTDVAKCKTLLEDSKGDVKQVIMLMGNLKI